MHASTVVHMRVHLRAHAPKSSIRDDPLHKSPLPPLKVGDFSRQSTRADNGNCSCRTAAHRCKLAARCPLLCRDGHRRPRTEGRAGRTCIGTHARWPAHLADVIEVAVWSRLLREKFLVGVELLVEAELLLKQHQPVVAERLGRAHCTDAQHPAHELYAKPFHNRSQTCLSPSVLHWAVEGMLAGPNAMLF